MANRDIKKKIEILLKLLDNEQDPTTYIFIKYDAFNGNCYRLAFNNDTYIDDDNYTFKTKEDIQTFCNQQAKLKKIPKIKPIIVNITD